MGKKEKGKKSLSWFEITSCCWPYIIHNHQFPLQKIRWHFYNLGTSSPLHWMHQFQDFTGIKKCTWSSLDSSAALNCRSTGLGDKCGWTWMVPRWHLFCSRNGNLRLGHRQQGQIQDFRKGAPTSAEGASFLGGSGGMLLQIFLKIWVSKMAISSILRQISYSFNSNFLLVTFTFVKRKKYPTRGVQGPPLVKMAQDVSAFSNHKIYTLSRLLAIFFLFPRSNQIARHQVWQWSILPPPLPRRTNLSNAPLSGNEIWPIPTPCPHPSPPSRALHW